VGNGQSTSCEKLGIAGFAEVSKEAYPDCMLVANSRIPSSPTDESVNRHCMGQVCVFRPSFREITMLASVHPYFDKKSDKDNPRWFMVDAKFVSRARHFVPLSLLRYLADIPSAIPPEAVSYVGEDGINAIKAMPLIARGRLSVQRVSAKCWDVMQTMADQGGWDNMSFEKKKTKKARHPIDEARQTTSRQKTKHSAGQRDEDGVSIRDDATKQPKEEVLRLANIKKGRKRKISTSNSAEDEGQPRHKFLRSKR